MSETETPADLRDALERAKAEAAEGQAAKRELAFIKAGIDTSTPMGSLFTRAYDGEIDADAIKAAAVKDGVIVEGDTPEAETPEVPSTETSDRRLLTASGETITHTHDALASIDAAYAERVKLKSEGASDQKSAAPVLAAILRQAGEGNPNFIFDADRWSADAMNQ